MPREVSISRRRITLSTAGVVPMMARVGEELGVNLAISLHAVSDAVRDILVPINRKYPIAELLEACRTYPRPDQRSAHHVRVRHAQGGQRFTRGCQDIGQTDLPAFPRRSISSPSIRGPDRPNECSDAETIDRFGDYVNRAGYASPVRAPRGRDIMAACGQLKSASEKKSRRLLDREASAAAPSA